MTSLGPYQVREICKGESLHVGTERVNLLSTLFLMHDFEAKPLESRIQSPFPPLFSSLNSILVLSLQR